MALQSRLDRMEKAIQPIELVRIEARDEADYSDQRISVLLANIKRAPCVVDLEVHMNGEVKQERMPIRTFEDYLELLD